MLNVIFFQQNAFKLTQGCLKEKLEPINAYTLDALKREEIGNRLD